MIYRLTFKEHNGLCKNNMLNTYQWWILLNICKGVLLHMTGCVDTCQIARWHIAQTLVHAKVLKSVIFTVLFRKRQEAIFYHSVEQSYIRNAFADSFAYSWVAWKTCLWQHYLARQKTTDQPVMLNI